MDSGENPERTAKPCEIGRVTTRRRQGGVRGAGMWPMRSRGGWVLLAMQGVGREWVSDVPTGRGGGGQGPRDRPVPWRCDRGQMGDGDCAAVEACAILWRHALRGRRLVDRARQRAAPALARRAASVTVL